MGNVRGCNNENKITENQPADILASKNMPKYYYHFVILYSNDIS